MSEYFSGRVFRFACSTRLPDYFSDAFFIGMGDIEQNRRNLKKYTDGLASVWEVDVVEFANAPKREPAILYRRYISTTVAAPDFVAGYFDGSAKMPNGSQARADGKETGGFAGWGSRESRIRWLEIDSLARGGDKDDPWFDVDLSYERFAARVLTAVPGGYDETVWFMSAGYEVDPEPMLLASVDSYVAELGGELVALDGPRPAIGDGGVHTGVVLSQVFRQATGPEDFEARIVSLEAWGAGAASPKMHAGESAGEQVQLVVELHVPLTPTSGLGEDEYPFPWIDEIMEEILALDEDGDAWMFDDGEEDKGEYVFFIAAKTEGAGLAVVARLATMPGLPTGAYAMVSSSDAAAFGLGRRVELSY
jgi:hypothetical protein